MYNHTKAQQSKNRVHISWDILYTVYPSWQWKPDTMEVHDNRFNPVFAKKVRQTYPSMITYFKWIQIWSQALTNKFNTACWYAVATHHIFSLSCELQQGGVFITKHEIVYQSNRAVCITLPIGHMFQFVWGKTDKVPNTFLAALTIAFLIENPCILVQICAWGSNWHNIK